MLPEALASLRLRLPPRWAVEPRADRSVDILTPERSRVSFRVIAGDKLNSAAIELMMRAPSKELILVVAPYLSPAVRDRLQKAGISYLDLTGNTRIAIDRPALFIERTGADRSPKRARASARSLKGEKAGRIVRVLIDRKTPPGLRELATLAGVDPGYASRVLTLLASESLIERGADEAGHGRARSVAGSVLNVVWPALLRRWAVDAPFNTRASFHMYLAPRGLTGMLEKLRQSKRRYAVTGSLAAARIAPVAPPRLATVYCDDPDRLAKELDLTPAESGANVILAFPKSDLAFSGVKKSDGLSSAALSQVATDLLGGPGRSPSEGEALIEWMTTNEDLWRV